MYEVSRSFHLHCSHIATRGDEACTRLHGHTFNVTLACRESHLDPEGFSIDFFDFDKAIARVSAVYDHRHLNDLLPHPTCENLAHSIFEIVRELLPELSWVEVDEIGIGKVKFFPSES